MKWAGVPSTLLSRLCRPAFAGLPLAETAKAGAEFRLPFAQMNAHASRSVCARQTAQQNQILVAAWRIVRMPTSRCEQFRTVFRRAVDVL